MPNLFDSHTDFKEWFGDPLQLAIENKQVTTYKFYIVGWISTAHKSVTFCIEAISTTKAKKGCREANAFKI